MSLKGNVDAQVRVLSRESHLGQFRGWMRGLLGQREQEVSLPPLPAPAIPTHSSSDRACRALSIPHPAIPPGPRKIPKILPTPATAEGDASDGCRQARDDRTGFKLYL